MWVLEMYVDAKKRILGEFLLGREITSVTRAESRAHGQIPNFLSLNTSDHSLYIEFGGYSVNLFAVSDYPLYDYFNLYSIWDDLEFDKTICENLNTTEKISVYRLDCEEEIAFLKLVQSNSILLISFVGDEIEFENTDRFDLEKHREKYFRHLRSEQIVEEVIS